MEVAAGLMKDAAVRIIAVLFGILLSLGSYIAVENRTRLDRLEEGTAYATSHRYSSEDATRDLGDIRARLQDQEARLRKLEHDMIGVRHGVGR